MGQVMGAETKKLNDRLIQGCSTPSSTPTARAGDYKCLLDEYCLNAYVHLAMMYVSNPPEARARGEAQNHPQCCSP